MKEGQGLCPPRRRHLNLWRLLARPLGAPQTRAT